MASLDLTFIEKLPPAFQLAAGLVFGAGLLAWVIPRYLTKAGSPPVGDKVVLEAASIANMTPVKEIAINLERIAIAGEMLVKLAEARDGRDIDRDEENHERQEREHVQAEIDSLKQLIEGMTGRPYSRPPYRKK